MSSSLGHEPRAIEPRDETPHEHGGEPGWVERVAFNFFDHGSDTGGIAVLEYRPAERKATGVIDLFLPGGEVATVMVRDGNARRADLTVGRVGFECAEQMRSWRLRCKDIALLFASAESANLARSERAGKAVPVEIDLAFESWGEPTGWAARRTQIDEQRFASIVSFGAFEQPGAYTGTVRVGNETTTLDGGGFRERTWGTRAEGGYWYAVAFGPDLSLSTGTVVVGGEQVSREWVYIGGRSIRPDGPNVVTLDDHGVQMTMEGVEGRLLDVRGEIVATIPPRPGDPVYRSLTRFSCRGTTALGVVETPTLVL